MEFLHLKKSLQKDKDSYKRICRLRIAAIYWVAHTHWNGSCGKQKKRNQKITSVNKNVEELKSWCCWQGCKVMQQLRRTARWFPTNQKQICYMVQQSQQTGSHSGRPVLRSQQGWTSVPAAPGARPSLVPSAVWISSFRRCAGFPHCCSHLQFPDGTGRGASFRVLICHLYAFFGEGSAQVFCPFLTVLFCFLIGEF